MNSIFVLWNYQLSLPSLSVSRFSPNQIDFFSFARCVYGCVNRTIQPKSRRWRQNTATTTWRQPKIQNMFLDNTTYQSKYQQMKKNRRSEIPNRTIEWSENWKMNMKNTLAHTYFLNLNCIDDAFKFKYTTNMYIVW